MQFSIERNENITPQRARGEAWSVRDQDGNRVGIISHSELGWRVFSAGWGVKVDQNEVHRARDFAIAAIIDAREIANQPGGALAIDESGLTGHQRAMIDFHRKYVQVTPERRNFVIWEQFDMSPTQFYSEWNALIDHPRALAYDPHVINRHLRLRDQRKARRSRVPVTA
jgi:hypothetical protein